MERGVRDVEAGEPNLVRAVLVGQHGLAMALNATFLVVCSDSRGWPIGRPVGITHNGVVPWVVRVRMELPLLQNLADGGVFVDHGLNRSCAVAAGQGSRYCLG